MDVLSNSSKNFLPILFVTVVDLGPFSVVLEDYSWLCLRGLCAWGTLGCQESSCNQLFSASGYYLSGPIPPVWKEWFPQFSEFSGNIIDLNNVTKWMYLELLLSTTFKSKLGDWKRITGCLGWTSLFFKINVLILFI